jgi:hypothetical protein
VACRQVAWSHEKDRAVPFFAARWNTVSVKAIAAAGGRRLSQSVAHRGGGLGLVAAAMLIVGLHLTFVSQVCPGGCVGISATLGESPDAWAVGWIASVLAVTAVLVLAGVAARLMAVVNAVAALAALGAAPERRSRPTVRAQRWGRATVSGASVCVLALACLGAFLPFATLSCGFGCPLYQPASASYMGALAGSGQGRVVVGLLVAAALATAVRVPGRGKLFASITALLLALAATVLVSFDSLNAATRVLGWPYGIPTVPGVGYYVLQIGTAACVVLSVLLVSADHPTWRLFRRGGLGAQEAAGSA